MTKAYIYIVITLALASLCSCKGDRNYINAIDVEAIELQNVIHQDLSKGRKYAGEYYRSAEKGHKVLGEYYLLKSKYLNLDDHDIIDSLNGFISVNKNISQSNLIISAYIDILDHHYRNGEWSSMKDKYIEAYNYINENEKLKPYHSLLKYGYLPPDEVKGEGYLIDAFKKSLSREVDKSNEYLNFKKLLKLAALVCEEGEINECLERVNTLKNNANFLKYNDLHLEALLLHGNHVVNSIPYYDEAIDLSLTSNISIFSGKAYLLKGEKLKQVGQYREALESVEKALTLDTIGGKTPRFYEVKILHDQMFYEVNPMKYDTVVGNIQNSIDSLIDWGQFDIAINGYEYLSNIESEAGNISKVNGYKQAIESVEQMNDLKVEIDNSVSNLFFIEHAKREADINLLEVNNEIMDSDITIQKLIAYISLILILFMALLVYFIYKKFNYSRKLDMKNNLLKLKNEELAKMVTSLEETNVKLDQIALVNANDFNAPLKEINTYATVLKASIPKENKEIEESLNYIIEDSNHLLATVDKLLNFANDYDKMAYDEIAVKDTVMKVLHRLDLSIGKDLNLLIQEKLPAIYSDSSLILQLFQNLISNAVKYSKDGTVPSITIGMNRIDGKDNVFHVKDYGIGIKSKDVRRVFKTFTQVDNTKEGHGVGLAICKRIVEKYGGEIWVVSKEETYTTFYFTLPLSKP